MNILFFDTETTGLYDFKLPPDHPSQPYLVQIAAVMVQETEQGGAEVGSMNLIIKPEDWIISDEVAKIHGISQELAERCGVPVKTAAFLFNNLCYQSDLLVAHNIDFDRGVMGAVMARLDVGHRLNRINRYCTMRSATPIVKIPRSNGQPAASHMYKWPSLTECMRFFFDEDFQNAHNAWDDVLACARVYWELRSMGV